MTTKPLTAPFAHLLAVRPATVVLGLSSEEGLGITSETICYRLIATIGPRLSPDGWWVVLDSLAGELTPLATIQVRGLTSPLRARHQGSKPLDG